MALTFRNISRGINILMGQSLIFAAPNNCGGRKLTSLFILHTSLSMVR
jgi:hypothetical protein